MFQFGERNRDFAPMLRRVVDNLHQHELDGMTKLFSPRSRVFDHTEAISLLEFEQVGALLLSVLTLAKKQ